MLPLFYDSFYTKNLESMMAKNQPYAGVYGSMTFPPYKYQEYPKWVGVPNSKQQVLVHNKIEEMKVLDMVVPVEMMDQEALAAKKREDELQSKIKELEAKLTATDQEAKKLEEMTAPASPTLKVKTEK